MLTRAARSLAHHPRLVALAAIVATLLLAVPLLTMPTDRIASQEPGGPAFVARDLLDTRLEPRIADEFVVLEAAAGQLLRPDTLRTWHRRWMRLRTEEPTASLLVADVDPRTGRPVAGASTLTDAVDDALADAGGLDGASDAQVTAAVDAILDQVGPTAVGLDDDATRTADGWVATAATVVLSLDNAALGGGSSGARVGADVGPREIRLREVRDVLRGGDAGDGTRRDEAGGLVAHAVAADVNLTAQEQGQAAGPIIGAAVLATLLLVGLVFRSAWVVGVVGAGIAALMIWLQGAANLLGLAQDQILATVVPIALVAFGVDFAFHAIGRVAEEHRAGRPPTGALAVGLAAVAGALLLALASDAAAFLANTVSGIESIVQFGVASSLGLAAAFLLLGIVAPVVLASLGVLDPAAPRPRAVTAAAGATAAASLAVASVLTTVYVDPRAGVTTFVVLVVGLLWAARRRTLAGAAAATVTVSPPPTRSRDTVPARLGQLVVGISRRGRIVLPAVAVVTAIAGFAASQVETRFDVQDFFDPGTDFVAGLDALDEHVGTTGGEPTRIVVTGALDDPRLTARLAAEVDDLRAQATGTFATDADGRTLVDGGLVDVLRRATAEDPTLGDGIPDTAAGIDAVLAALDGPVAAGDGPVAADDGSALARTADRAAGVVDRAAAGDVATVLTLQLPGSRETSAIAAARAELDPRITRLRADLTAVDPDATVELTGAPVVRQLTLDAITTALLWSLPVAVLLCLGVAAVALRSVRLAVVAIVPILVVVPWLYGLMAATGTAVNLVTGTIGALSIGIGIDFAIHLTARFREELATSGDRDLALQRAGAGTGLALIASAGSSALGFLVLAAAPMPLFATFGWLTAAMIGMALVATLTILPPLLRATARRPSASSPPRAADDVPVAV